MKKLLTLSLVLFAALTTARAVSFDYSPTPTNLYDLDHHSAYTWRIDNILLGGQSITGASLTFTNIRNWDTNPNILFIHLFDTAKGSGVRSFLDATGTPVPISQMQDNFAGSLLASNPLIAAGTGNTFLASPSFTTIGSTYTFQFNAAQLSILQGYIMNGNNVAFGLDPDCHFYNDGIHFRFTTARTAAVPESGAGILMLALAFTALAVARRLSRAKKAVHC